MISVCLVALLCGAPASPHLPRALFAASQVAGEAEADGANERQSSQLRRPLATSQAQDQPDVDFRQFHETLGWNFTRGLFAVDNVWPLVIGAGSALAVIPIDEELSDELRGRVDELGDTGHVVGNPVTVAVSVAALVVAAPLTDNRTFRAFSYSLAQAQILDSALKYGLKFAASRTRPNGENDNSFPSGHTSATFAFATVAGHYYGKKVSIPAYTIAALVGASRIEKGKHFLSDVVFGATLGYLAGQIAVRGTEHTAAGPRITLHPVVGFGRSGIMARLRF